MASKAILFLGLFLATVLLISSQVAARELDETSNSPKEADANYDGYHGGGGHYGGGGGRGGGGHYGGGGGRGGGGHYGGGGGRGGGRCRYGCCGRSYGGGCRCCKYAEEKVNAEIKT